MAQSNSEHTTTSQGVRTALVVMLVLIFGGIIFFMAYSHLPRAGGGNSNTTSDLVTPTVIVTNPVSSLTLNCSVIVNGVQITVTQVQQARSFSDVGNCDQFPTTQCFTGAQQAGSSSDVSNRTGPYTVRVYMQAKNNGQAPIGIDFSTQAKLLLPGGRTVSPQVMSISPVMMPDTTQSGFFDFPVQNPVSLTALTLHLDAHTVVSFGS